MTCIRHHRRLADPQMLLKSLFLCVLLPLAGCRTPDINRAAEMERFGAELQRRLAELDIKPGDTLALERCVEIALRNNLDYRVRQLRATLQDDKVRLSLVDGLPTVNANYAATRRSNKAMAEFGGLVTETEDQNMQVLGVRAVVPVLEWGTTYYAWQIAKDRRSQEQLMVTRARQLLIRDVQVAYVRLAAAERQERLGRIAIIAADELLRTARSLEREGFDSRASTAEVEATLAQARQQWTALKRNVEVSRLALAQTMSLPAGLGLAIHFDLPPLRALPQATAVPGLEDLALRARPEIQVQDVERHAAANAVRQDIAQFVPHLDLFGGYNWSSASTMVNPAFFNGGVQVTEALLNGGRDWWNLRLARKTVTVEEERTLLLSLGILYEVDFNLISLYSAHDAVTAWGAVVKARMETLRLVSSRYRQGLDSSMDAVRALADLYLSRLQLDRNQADYQVAWYELEAAAPAAAADAAAPAAPVLTGKLPAFAPAPAVEPGGLGVTPVLDPTQFPKLQGLLKP